MAELEDEPKYDAVQRPISTAHASIDSTGKITLHLGPYDEIVATGAAVVAPLRETTGDDRAQRVLPGFRITVPLTLVRRRYILTIPCKELRRASRRFRHKRKMRLRRGVRAERDGLETPRRLIKLHRETFDAWWKRQHRGQR